MGHDARLRLFSPGSALARCVLTLQRDGKVRIEGDARILESIVRHSIAVDRAARKEALVKPATQKDMAAALAGRCN